MNQSTPNQGRGASLRCPSCKQVGGFTLPPARAGAEANQPPTCRFCGHRLAWHERAIADVLPPDEDRSDRPFTQKVMETNLFALMYETPVWRPLHTLVGSGMFIGRWVERLLDLSETAEPKRAILDLACGTGHYARALGLRDPEAEVYGLDLSLSMLRQGARIHAKREFRPERLVWVRGDMMELPFGDASMDQINCCGALHLFPDLVPVWKEIARVLKPGGILTGEAVCVNPLVAPLQRRLMRRKKATFFEEAWLRDALAAVGLFDLHYERHRVLAMFRATRRD